MSSGAGVGPEEQFGVLYLRSEGLSSARRRARRVANLVEHLPRIRTRSAQWSLGFLSHEPEDPEKGWPGLSRDAVHTAAGLAVRALLPAGRGGEVQTATRSAREEYWCSDLRMIHLGEVDRSIGHGAPPWAGSSVDEA